MKTWLASSLLLTVALIAGCSQPSDTTTTETSPADADATSSVSTTMNEYCPIMGSEVTEDGGRTEWNGQMVGFCCPGCIEKFEALSDDEKAAALAKAEAEHAGHNHGDHDHGNHDHGTHDGEATEAS